MGMQGTTVRLPLLPSDTEIDIRVFVDNTVVEVFWLGGRSVMTVDASAASIGTELSVCTYEGSDVTVKSASAWEMGSAWVTPEEVLATPRPKPHALSNSDVDMKLYV